MPVGLQRGADNGCFGLLVCGVGSPEFELGGSRFSWPLFEIAVDLHPVELCFGHSEDPDLARRKAADDAFDGGVRLLPRGLVAAIDGVLIAWPNLLLTLIGALLLGVVLFLRWKGRESGGLSRKNSGQSINNF